MDASFALVIREVLKDSEHSRIVKFSVLEFEDYITTRNTFWNLWDLESKDYVQFVTLRFVAAQNLLIY